MSELLPPLAFRLRPKIISEIIGQSHLVGPQGFLTNCLKAKTMVSIIFFGPPGCGKTTLAETFAKSFSAHVIKLNAVTTNKKDIENALEEARLFFPTFLIMDEVHRLNRDRQELLLASLEAGQIYLIGATTENPYMALNKALRSRTHLLEVKPLSDEELMDGLKKALHHPDGLSKQTSFTDEALTLIAKRSGGDLRFAYNSLEILALSFPNQMIGLPQTLQTLGEANFGIDENEDQHYDAVSALQKSIRGSDVDAALYYLARLCLSGDLDSIARRLLVTAYEDVGLGNPAAVSRTARAIDDAKSLGFPEAIIPLSFAVCELSLSPKSRAAADSIDQAMRLAKEVTFEVQPYLKFTPVNLKEADKYPYNRPDLWEKIQYLPEKLREARIYLLNDSSLGSYEKQLNENYTRLKKIVRSANLKSLK